MSLTYGEALVRLSVRLTVLPPNMGFPDEKGNRRR